MMTYEKIIEYAKVKNHGLSATDFNTNIYTYYSNKDDLAFGMIPSSFVESKDGWYIIYQEHGEPIILSIEETRILVGLSVIQCYKFAY